MAVGTGRLEQHVTSHGVPRSKAPGWASPEAPLVPTHLCSWDGSVPWGLLRLCLRLAVAAHYLRSGTLVTECGVELRASGGASEDTDPGPRPGRAHLGREILGMLPALCVYPV